MTAGRQSVSITKDWCTPPHILDATRTVFGGEIGLDPCSNEYSLVGARNEYCLPDKDGLSEQWDSPTIFVNPPYGSDPVRKTRILDWFKKIGEASERGSEIIALVPVATNTRHWKDYVYPIASAICFLYAPRLKFYIRGEEDPKGAPMSCATIYYGNKVETFKEAFGEMGAVIPLGGIAVPSNSHSVSQSLSLF